MQEGTKELNLSNTLSLSMDGPSVNWKFVEFLQEEHREQCGGAQLQIIGSCGLHTMHNAFKNGLCHYADIVGWKTFQQWREPLTFGHILSPMWIRSKPRSSLIQGHHHMTPLQKPGWITLSWQNCISSCVSQEVFS